MAVITPESLIRTPSGKAWRAYSGVRGTGSEAAVSVTLLNIERSPEQDLLVNLYYGFDGRSLGAGEYVGIDVSIDDSSIILFNNMIVGNTIADQKHRPKTVDQFTTNLFYPEIVNYRLWRMH